MRREHMRMRINSFKAILPALFSIWLTATVDIGQAQTLELVNTDTTWRYNQAGVDLGTGWRAPTFNDSGWEGPGQILFGYETTPAEYSPLTFRTPFVDPLTVFPEVNTYYFRTHFTMPNNPPNILRGTVLISSNWVDDGS